jgi:tRNA splicing endonuclease
MIIIGVDYHPSFQTIAFLIEETGEYGEQELNHSDGEAERFYRKLKERGVGVRVGNGGHRTYTLVRAVTRRVGFRVVDWRSGGD